MSGWADLAACREVDPELFFPDRGSAPKAAKRICAGCSVKEPCLEDALRVGRTGGVWGGLSEKERRGLRRQRVRAGSRS
jgi:WhiB family redox-sensing transcriptional regulator